MGWQLGSLSAGILAREWPQVAFDAAAGLAWAVWSGWRGTTIDRWSAAGAAG
jgi:hypothetical protein